LWVHSIGLLVIVLLLLPLALGILLLALYFPFGERQLRALDV